MQVILQLLIIITGNYGFFNFLTIALTVPCLDENMLDIDNIIEIFDYSPLKTNNFITISIIAFLSYVFFQMFNITMVKQKGTSIEVLDIIMKLSPTDFQVTFFY